MVVGEQESIRSAKGKAKRREEKETVDRDDIVEDERSEGKMSEKNGSKDR